VKNNKNFPVFERSEFRGKFYCFRRAAFKFFQPREFSYFVLLLIQKNEDE